MGRVSIASSNAKVQYYQFTSIHSNDHDPLSKFPLHDLNSPPKSTHCKGNEETKKITRPNNTSNLSTIIKLESKKTIGLNNTNSLSSEHTISQKVRIYFFCEERISLIT